MKKKQTNMEAAVKQAEINRLKAELRYCLEIFALIEKLQNRGNTFDFSDLKKRIEYTIA